ncbi:helix-turn-helix domain-containing protein [Halovivax gelatinilyticus]|uniref:helix-turn-helix domain-containing protein n=1 Tax=Halovivax gelatinilyticus TaxID=2961597 RepID=UPI0020CA4050|nr:helix-turn-helix domain-containing protein [Halovivax gelatinilyticus]
MDHLDDVSADDLRVALDEATGKKPAMRLIAAIAYKSGISQTELASWYGVERKTIYNWLTRLDDAPLANAATDERRPGRPRKLAEDERAAFEDAVRRPPTAAGYDARTWTPELVKTYLEDRYDVEYSIPSCRRLMRDAGLRFRRPSRAVSGETDGIGASDEGRWLPE